MRADLGQLIVAFMAQVSPAPVAVVTGASSGIGRAFVHELRSRGYACVAADCDTIGLHRLANSDVHSARDVALDVVTTDVSVPEDIQRLADYTFDRFGRVDVLLNCAGILSAGLSWEISSEEWRRLLDVNLFSVVDAHRAFMPRLIEQGSGHIVNIASMAAVTSGAMVGPYSASKHGVLAVSECLAREIASLGLPIKVSVVCPGAVDTGIATAQSATVESGAAAMAGLRQVISAGMSPVRLVALVLEGLDRDEFCIFPHADVRKSARRRVDQLLSGRLDF